jgi:hypothetical protein
LSIPERGRKIREECRIPRHYRECIITTSTRQLTPHHLTAEQVETFDEQGYLVLKNRIPADLLLRLQDAAAR